MSSRWYTFGACARFVKVTQQTVIFSICFNTVSSVFYRSLSLSAHFNITICNTTSIFSSSKKQLKFLNMNYLVHLSGFHWKIQWFMQMILSIHPKRKWIVLLLKRLHLQQIQMQTRIMQANTEMVSERSAANINIYATIIQCHTVLSRLKCHNQIQRVCLCIYFWYFYCKFYLFWVLLALKWKKVAYQMRMW